MVWWFWLLLGLVLLAVELATPGGLLALFFGIAALLVGVLSFLGWAGPAWMQWLLFSILSIAALALLRGPLQARLNVGVAHKAVDSLEGELAVVTEDVEAGGVGKVELRGSSWTARTTGTTLARGRRCLVKRREGLTLWVESE